MSQYSPPPRRSYGGRLAVAIIAGLVVVFGLATWANALTQPVVRAGVPTGKVEAPAPPPTTAPASQPTPSSPTTSGEPPASAATPPASPETPTPPPVSTSPTPTPTKPTATPKPTKPTATPKPTKPADPFATSTLKRGAVSGAGKQHSFIVRVEKASKLTADEVAAEIADTLNDPRGWAGKGTVRFALVADPKKADFTVYVSTPNLVDAACDPGAAVCVRGDKLVLGSSGWKTPATPWGSDATGFRRYLVNNAVGTWLGEKKASCPKAGRPAPVMSAQTSDLKGCTPNPWPPS